MKIEYKDFDNALTLLRAQLGADRGGHQFSVSLNYLKRIKESLDDFIVDGGTKNTFFETIVVNNAFYAFQDYFYVKKYYAPKGIFGLRQLIFMSPGMLFLYYSYCLSLARRANACRDFIARYSSVLEKNCCKYKTFSGAKLHFNPDETLAIKKDTISYTHEYKEFIKQIKDASNPSKGQKIVIKMDVEKYYENFKIEKLLNYINEFSLTNEGTDLFTSAFIEDSVDFFKLIGDSGLPQEQSFIVSQYLSDLYLTRFDLAFLNHLQHQNIVFSYFRYVDDIYLIIDDSDVNKSAIQKIIQSAEQIMKEKLDLSISIKKGEVHLISDKIVWKKMIHSLSFISLVDEESQIQDLDITFDDAQLKIMEILGRLSALRPEDIFSLDFSEDKRCLNLVFAKHDSQKVLASLKRNFNTELTDIKNKLDIDVINIAPKPICAIFDEDPTFYPWLISKIDSSKITDHRFYLVFHYLIQEPGIAKEIEGKISKHYRDMLHALSRDCLPVKEFIRDSSNHWIYRCDNAGIIECITQLKKMKIAEIEQSLGLAINHLTNLMSAFIYSLDVLEFGCATKQKDYQKWHVIDFLNLRSRNVSIEDIAKVSKLFERRNKNSISHSIGGSVSSSEYTFYKETIMRVLSTFQRHQIT